VKNILNEKMVSIRKKPINFKLEDEHIFKHEYSREIPASFYYHLKHVFLLDDVIFNPFFFKFYSKHSKIESLDTVAKLKRLRYLTNPGNIIDKGVWILDDWSGGYFHWFTDALVRLVAVIDQLQGHIVLLPEVYRYLPYIQESLQILGIKAHYYNKKSSVYIKNLILTSHIAPSGNYNDAMMKKVRDQFILPNKQQKLRNIYISRAKAGKRKITNEDELQKTLIEIGYEIHFFEDYSIEKQISIMSQSNSLIALHGAALTNMLFMPENGKIFEIRNEMDTHNNCFYSLASSLNHDYYYYLTKADHNDGHSSNVYIDVKKLKHILTNQFL
jgi:capsular polysaccharide biosynthesis protein